MRQVWITKAGPPEVLQVREAPDPTPRAGEVRIRVEASGINFADLLARMGLYPDAPNRRQVKPRPSGSRSRWEVLKRVWRLGMEHPPMRASVTNRRA